MNDEISLAICPPLSQKRKGFICIPRTLTLWERMKYLIKEREWTDIVYDRVEVEEGDARAEGQIVVWFTTYEGMHGRVSIINHPYKHNYERQTTL